MNPPTDYRMTDYNFHLIPNKWLREKEKQGTLVGLSPGHPAWGLLYYAVLSNLQEDRNNVLLEVGTNQGGSTIIMAQALVDSGRNGGIITIEKDPVSAEIARENFASAGITGIHQIVGDSQQVLTEINELIHFAFIDGSHEEEDVIGDFEGVYKILAAGGMILFDNTTMGGVNRALVKIQEKWHGNLVEFPFVSWSPPGMAIWKRT